MENSPMSNQEGAASSGTGPPPLLEQAKMHGSQIAQQTQQKAGDLMDQARTQMMQQLTGQKDTAAAGIGSVAEAFRMTGEQLRTKEQASVGEYADRAAELVDGISGYLRERSVEDLTREVENFARRQPAVFVGGAFALGFLASRFLKSSAAGGQGGGRYLPARTDDLSASDSMAGYRRRIDGDSSDVLDVTAGGTLYEGDPTATSPRGKPVQGGVGRLQTSAERAMGSSSTSGSAGNTDDSAQLSGTSGE